MRIQGRGTQAPDPGFSPSSALAVLSGKSFHLSELRENTEGRTEWSRGATHLRMDSLLTPSKELLLLTVPGTGGAKTYESMGPESNPCPITC